jgi:bifunctional DNase/RNase
VVGKDPDYAEQAKSNAALHGVVLKERVGDRELCIFMGQFEAAAIAVGKEGKTFARPMTHHLIGDFMRSLDDFAVERVTITRLEDKTFYAEIPATHHGDAMTVDCRPSDGIAVALRLDVPIFVSQDVPPFSKAA